MNKTNIIDSRSFLLNIIGLKKYFPQEAGLFGTARHYVRAVDGVSLSIPAGKTLGLVGESGSGKTTLGRCILRLTEPDEGEIFFSGENILEFSHGEMRALRRKMQIVFQDPFGSLNPRITVGSTIAEPLAIHKLVPGKRYNERAAELLRLVGLTPEHAGRYPHEFSGGQRQRIGIARALAVEPVFIIADEPVSALDVSIRAQILNLLKDLQEKLNLTYLFIAHDLAVIRSMSDITAVMYSGKIMEIAPTKELFANPLHPYTQVLLSAIPVPDPKKRRQAIELKGEIPSPLHPPGGCRFAARCPYVTERARQEEPPLIDAGGGHYVACFLHQ